MSIENAHKITVISALHDHDCHEKHLEALASQTLDCSEFEVIYVDGWHQQDEDAVRSVIERFKQERRNALNVRFLRVERAGRGACFNRGIEAANSDLILLLADDFVASPDLIAHHLAVHEGEPNIHVVAVGPGIFPLHIQKTHFMNWLEESGSLFGTSFVRSQEIPESFFYGANTSLKKAFVQHAGLFEEAFPHHTTDDFELGKRLFKLGMEVRYVPQALAYHEHVIDLTSRGLSMREAGESALIYERKHGEIPGWQEPLENSSLQLALSAFSSRVKWWLTRKECHLHGYYIQILAREYAIGYWKAKRSPLESSSTH